MKDKCEICGARPALIDHGPFAGDYGMFDYCEHCSKDLCEKCMATGRCFESPDDKHKKADLD